MVATTKRTLVAFFFGFVLSALFAIALSARFEPLVKLERESVDFGLRIANAVYNESAAAVDLPDGASPIVMVDVDARACAMLASENRCNFDRIVQPEVVAAAMEAVAVFDPQVAVLDMIVPPEAGAALAEQMHADGQPILTAMDLSALDMAGNARDRGFLLSDSLCGATTCGRLEYLPAETVRQDGKARYYERATQVRLLESLDGTPLAARTFPTLPFRAAEIAADRVLQADSDPKPQIGYTFPSFLGLDLDDASARKRRGDLNRIYGYGDNIAYYMMSTIKESADAPIEVENLPDDPILIIGSSAEAGGDLHNTPLGPMGGVEVVANAIRSFQLAAPEKLPSPGEAFLTKIKAVIKALFIIAIVEVFLAYFAMRRDQAADAGRAVVGGGAFWDRWSIPVLLTMLAAFVGEFLLTIWEIISQLNEDAGRAGAVDVIWPVVGVTISALIGFSGEIVSKIDWLVDKAFALSDRLIPRP